ncbi:DUF4405 domain-containing protein [Pseudodonghicola flavimaris]|uniref:DUF4405 domain-containing protein n=1 Tax=Pseudodonghicola flavimaris TaxID=3050036 RepID=A0ABT7EXS2_9RHOB|nr:DUF4405 domain-containing protein [Pseudodonghicola flavimaris]MDK3017133.1 DUF4405 domain-containing protein [Pseudodonghicola flavimaris]
MKVIRKWATPLTMGAFLLSAVTGILMFFHWDSGYNKLAHEWLSWAMVAGVGAHVLVNFRAFKTYFRKPLALGIVGVFAGVLAVSFVPAPQGSGSPVAMVMRTLNAAPIETVIALSGSDTATGLQKLASAGIEATPGQSLAALTGGDRNQQVSILRLLMEE